MEVLKAALGGADGAVLALAGHQHSEAVEEIDLGQAARPTVGGHTLPPWTEGTRDIHRISAGKGGSWR